MGARYVTQNVWVSEISTGLTISYCKGIDCVLDFQTSAIKNIK